MYNLENKIALVTGASGNLGSAVARSLLESGVKLCILERDIKPLRRIFPESSESPGICKVFQTDVTDPDSVKRAIDEVLAAFKRIDVLVNTVGGYRAGTPLHETGLDTFDFMVTLNARSVFITCQAVVPAMLEQKSGKIINIAARPGLKGIKNASAYSAAKSAVLRITESLSAELKNDGINVNAVLPGTIDTIQNRETMPGADFSRWVSPESLAGVILFLVSEHAQDIHGAAIPVYGLS
jgi:NAD(P)-dependent dehydrogenase (short-subunit alcohol dehydrogenase family)